MGPLDDDYFPAAGPSRLPAVSHSPSLSPLSPPPARRKRRLSNSSDDEYEPQGRPTHSALTNLRGGGKPHGRAKANAHATANRARPPDTASGRKRVTRARARRNSSPSIATDLESIASEDAAVKSEVTRLSLGLRDVQGDGNCLFRALADQLWGNQKRHVEVRKLVCDYLETHKESMEAFVRPFLSEEETYENYVERMRQPKQFGSHIEIQAAARVFRRNIRVVMSTASFTIPWEWERPGARSPPPDDHTDDEEAHGRPVRRTRSTTTSLLSTPAAPPPSSPLYATALAEYIPAIRPGRSMLWLALFALAEHFQSVRRKGDRDSGPAEVEDTAAIPHARDMSESARRQRGEHIDKTPSAKVSEVLASLPPGHGITAQQAAGVLARVKGDLGEAVEILLEDLDIDTMSDLSSSDQQVEHLLETSPYRDPSDSYSSSQSDGESSKTSSTSKITTPAESSDDGGDGGEKLVHDLGSKMIVTPESGRSMRIRIKRPVMA